MFFTAYSVLILINRTLDLIEVRRVFQKSNKYLESAIKNWNLCLQPNKRNLEMHEDNLLNVFNSTVDKLVKQIGSSKEKTATHKST